ncbi:hypothetical protein [Paraliobacillus ryukyuensis]|uniref:hypothetical protein n=1 Tax=Paraliobacillus ryukyuensis TaxID=200904 RepID=UPI0009A587AE|nr:hypothetical protein [Paraliobacillus ryukyuensis]
MNLLRDEFDSFINSLKDLVKLDEHKVIERISMHIESKYLDILTSLEHCESPIEKIFALEIDRELNNSKLQQIPFVTMWTPQKEIKIFTGSNNEQKYRLDFLIEVHNMQQDSQIGFAVECDGHEFHEKSKKQVAKDKKRDRDLLKAGIIPIRFSGSEILNEPMKVSRETVQIIEKYIFNMYK